MHLFFFQDFKNVSYGLLFYLITIIQTKKFENLHRDRKIDLFVRSVQIVKKILVEREILLFPLSLKLITGLFTSIQPTLEEFKSIEGPLKNFMDEDVKKMNNVCQIEFALFLEKNFKEIFEHKYKLSKGKNLVSKENLESILELCFDHCAKNNSPESSQVWTLLAENIINQGKDFFIHTFGVLSQNFDSKKLPNKKASLLLMNEILNNPESFDKEMATCVFNQSFLKFFVKSFKSKLNTLSRSVVFYFIFNFNFNLLFFFLVKQIFGIGFRKIKRICIRTFEISLQ